MITNTKTSSLRLGACLLMVPACAIMLMSFGKKPHEAQFGIVLRVPRVATQSTPDISPVDLTKVTEVVLYGKMMDRRTNKLKNHSGIDFYSARDQTLLQQRTVLSSFRPMPSAIGRDPLFPLAIEGQIFFFESCLS